MKRLTFLPVLMMLLVAFTKAQSQNLKINDLEYFETQGVNVLVYSNLFSGGFNDESTYLNDHEIIII
jgi:endoglucanase